MFFKSDSELIQGQSSRQAVDPESPPIFKLVFGLFKNLNDPFDANDSLYSQFSPVRGADNQIIKNLRLHGPYEPQDKGFPRPTWDGRDSHNFPQNWTASLLEFIAPSHIGFLFDSVLSTPFHDWLKPKNIAFIFNTIIEESFYDNPKESVLKLARCLQPEVDFQKLELEEKKRLKHNQTGPKYGAFSKLKSLSWPTREQPFAEILFEALNETKEDGTLTLGYPPHIVALILLTYMWNRKKSKIDLKPFYESLSERIIHQSDINTIVWENEGSFYTQRDYTEQQVQSNETPHRIIRLENELLLKLGCSYFGGPFPIPRDYGVSVVKIGRKGESFSDCGEISLLNYFMMALYDPYTKQFNWEKFEELKKAGFNVSEKLTYFFKRIYISPLCDFTQEIRNAWADTLSNLNKDNDEDPIHYLRNKCCIAPGLDNMTRVIRALLGAPKKYCYAYDEFLEPLNLMKSNRLYPYRFWKWSCEATLDDSQNLTLTFKYSGFAIFEWHFQKAHFDFNKIEHAKQRAYRIYYLDKSNISQIPIIESEEKFSEDLFSGRLKNHLAGNLDSIEGKCYAIYKIFCFKNKFKNNAFDYLIHRWIEPSGKYFARWEDEFTNKAFIKFLIEECNLSPEAILKMNIPALTAHVDLLKSQSNSEKQMDKLSLKFFKEGTFSSAQSQEGLNLNIPDRSLACNKR